MGRLDGGQPQEPGKYAETPQAKHLIEVGE